MNWFKKLLQGLKKTQESISTRLSFLFKKGELDSEFFEELEFTLISSDMGVQTTQKIIDEVKLQCKKQKIKTQNEFKAILKQILINLLKSVDEFEVKYPTALLIVGVNGVGKTTTIGKLGNYFKEMKKNVLFVAGDTFRAAASEQLSEWATRSKVRIVKQNEGADSASVVFDGLKSAIIKKEDVILIDTAGRLHNKENLMEEIKKIDRVIKKEWKYEFKKLIVLDATTGQNAINQVKVFNDVLGVDGIILTKLDGTSKGGIIIPIISELKIPIAFVGVGEKLDDLLKFNAEEFVDAIL
jgi:fused signal recognition particle receptor